MPRRTTPVRELLKEDAVPSSPLRRSSRISNSSPVPTKVVSRRNSATETSVATPKATRSRRSSLSQDQESEAAEIEVDKKPPVKTPRTRRASLNTNNEESAMPEEETATKGKTPDSKKPVTRRRRSASLDPEAIEEEPVMKTRARSASASKSGESVEDPKSKNKPSENGHSEVDEEIDQLEVGESKSMPKKKKLDTLKVDLDLSVIKESSFIEDEDKESGEIQDGNETTKEKANVKVQDKKSEPVATAEEESVAVKENGQPEEKPAEAIIMKEVSSFATKKIEDGDDTMVEKAIVENSRAEEKIVIKEKSSVTTKKTEDSEDVDGTTKEKPVVGIEKPFSSEENSIIQDATDVTAAEKKKSEAICAPETEVAEEEIESIEKQTSADIKEKTATGTKEKEKLEDDQIQDKFDSPSILKENPSVKELSDASFSDSSFHLQLSTSVLDDINKTGGNLSPTSNKENVRPQQKSEEAAPEPMDVDESFSEIPSPNKIVRKSMNITEEQLKLDDVEKKLEIAEKVTDEIAQFLTEGIAHTSESVPKIVLTISGTTEDSTKETTVDMSTVEYEKPIKEVNDISLKKSQVEETSKEKSTEKESNNFKEKSTVERIGSQEENKGLSDSLSDSNISLAIDEESTDLAKIQEHSLSEDPKTSEEVALNVAPQEKENEVRSPENEDSIVQDKTMENSQVADERLSISLNDADISIHKAIKGPQEKTVEEPTLEKSLVEVEDCKQEKSVESTGVQEQVTQISATAEDKRREVASENTVQKEEAENLAERFETFSCSLGDSSVTAEVQEKDTSVGDMKPNEEMSDVAESQVSDVEKKEVEESEEEIVVDDEADIVGYGEKEDNGSSDQEATSTALERNTTITVSSPFLNKSEMEDDEDSSLITKAVNEGTTAELCFVKPYPAFSERGEIEVRHDIYQRNTSSREIVILSDDENSPEDKVEEENEVATASDEEVEFVREDFEPTVVKVSPRNDNEANIQETLSVEKMNSLNSSKSWVDKTTFVMQETLRAEEDKETSLRDRIHKVVDLFCSEIKNKGDISINVSLECTGQNSDASDHETTINHGVVNVEAALSNAEGRELVHKGSKRRKLYHSQNYDAAMFAENTSEDTKQSEDTTLQKKKKKKRKLHKKTCEEQVQSKEESEKQMATTSKEQETSPKKKSKKQKSSSSIESHNEEEMPPPKKKSKKQKSAIVTESHEEEVSQTKKARKRKDDAAKIEEIEDNQNKNKKNVSKTKYKRQEISEEKREILPNKNENVTVAESGEEETDSSPFARYFSSSFNIDDSEDENDVTYQPSRDFNSTDSDLLTDESLYIEYTSSEELEEAEETSLHGQKNRKEKTTESKRLLYSSDDNEGVADGSGSEDVFMDEAVDGEGNSEQDTSKSENKKQKKSKQKRKNGQSDVSDEGKLQSSLKKGKKVKQSEAATVETSPNVRKKHKKRAHTYDVPEEDEVVVPERKIKKEKSLPFKPAAEKVISLEKAKKVPNVKTRVGKNVGIKSDKKIFKLKPSTAAPSGWDVEIV